MIRFLQTMVAALLLVPPLAGAATVTAYKTASCGCCEAWVEHMRDAGFTLDVEDVDRATLVDHKRDLGLDPDLAACHTAVVDGYVVEGHVPAEDVRRMLDERPDIAGIAVPGMPQGSPGMDFGQGSERYDVIAFDRAGDRRVYARH